MINLAKAFVTAMLVATAAITPAKAETSFLEAALFFLTGVEPGPEDIVTDQEILLLRYSIAAYLVDGKPCAVRIRNRLRIWEMDFCKIVSYHFSVHVGAWDFRDDSGGDPDKCAFVVADRVVHENYMGDLIGRQCDPPSAGFVGYTNINQVY
jgi:hypothetical protein